MLPQSYYIFNIYHLFTREVRKHLTLKFEYGKIMNDIAPNTTHC